MINHQIMVVHCPIDSDAAKRKVIKFHGAPPNWQLSASSYPSILCQIAILYRMIHFWAFGSDCAVATGQPARLTSTISRTKWRNCFPLIAVTKLQVTQRVCTLSYRGTCVIVRSFYIVRPYYDTRHSALSQAASLEDSQGDSPHIYGHCLSRGTRRSVDRAACDRTANEQDRHLRSFWIEGTATVGYGRSRQANLLGAGGTAF